MISNYQEVLIEPPPTLFITNTQIVLPILSVNTTILYNIVVTFAEKMAESYNKKDINHVGSFWFIYLIILHNIRSYPSLILLVIIYYLISAFSIWEK